MININTHIMYMFPSSVGPILMWSTRSVLSTRGLSISPEYIKYFHDRFVIAQHQWTRQAIILVLCAKRVIEERTNLGISEDRNVLGNASICKYIADG